MAVAGIVAAVWMAGHGASRPPEQQVSASPRRTAVLSSGTVDGEAARRDVQLQGRRPDLLAAAIRQALPPGTADEEVRHVELTVNLLMAGS